MVRRLLLLLALAAALTGCGTSLLDDPNAFCPAPDPSAVCFTDQDCVPDGCCGEGSCAVLSSGAPSCDGVRCSGTCDPTTVDCGCGVPVCRSGTCTVARTVGGGC